MSNKDKKEVLVDVQEVYSKAERYIEENRKSLAIIVGALVLVIGGYFAWKQFYLKPLEDEAQTTMFMAQKYFEQDSIQKAIDGDGNYKGFKYIIEEYGITKSANLAHYYLGICYLNQGKFQEAIDNLKEFETEDEILGPIATGAIGDANMELNKKEEAVTFYLKAAKQNDNKFTSPLYLMKAAMAYEEQNDYKNAVKIYEQIKSNYPDSNEGREVERYLNRAKMLAGI
ncbi:MAG: tetratricopeptide repeat protein [Bacteroidia bacterium]|nr:tetratricopeptide repeat protein [Bacteroidia bacterium]MCZ2249823.1 tetratricopeptide repeat protein [Bacteroidia bacterium]